MHIGMIVGIGPAATDHYYRYLTRHKLLSFQIPTLSAMHARLRLELRTCQ
jgi:aspartate/glutamate racemase